MTVADLEEVLSHLADNMPVHVIFDGKIDDNPDWNVDEVLYIEGAS